MINEAETVRDIGEFGLIERLRAALPPEASTAPSLLLGIGDDAAVWSPPNAETLVISTDSLVENVHFRLDPGWSSWADVGHKALAVNLSDLAAMGAGAGLAVVTLALTGSELVTDLEEGYRALGALAARSGCLVAGGDIVSSPAVAIHLTVVGQPTGDHVLQRDGARPGDLIGVSGTLGASAAGLRLLQMDDSDPRRLATTASELVAAHRRPEPRLALGRLLVAHGVSAAMDLSDGLLGDLPKILAASGVAASIDIGRIPVAAAVRALFPEAWQELAMRGGEDFELLFTIPETAWPALAEAATDVAATVTPIGRITRHEGARPMLSLRQHDGTNTTADRGAFDHFRPE